MNYNDQHTTHLLDFNALPVTQTLGFSTLLPARATYPARAPADSSSTLPLDLDALLGLAPAKDPQQQPFSSQRAADGKDDGLDLDALLRDALGPNSALSSPAIAAHPLSPVPSLEPLSPAAAVARSTPFALDLPHVELTHSDTHLAALLGAEWLAPATTAAHSLDAALASATAAAAGAAAPHAAGAALTPWTVLPAPPTTTTAHDVPALEPPAKKRQRATLLPPVIHLPAGPAQTATVIPTRTRKSKPPPTSCLPAVLAYPKSMVAHDAPVASNPRKRGRAAMDDDDDEQQQQHLVLPANPALVDDPAQQKRITNALSARRSRARKEAKLAYLEAKVDQLERDRAQLEAQLAELAAQLVAGGAHLASSSSIFSL